MNKLVLQLRQICIDIILMLVIVLILAAILCLLIADIIIFNVMVILFIFLACAISFNAVSYESFGSLDDCPCDNLEACDYYCRRACEDLQENKRRKATGESY